MQLADLVATSATLAGTRSRSAKVRALADLLGRSPHEESAVLVGFLVGAPRQGRVGVGWSTLAHASDIPPAMDPSLTLADVDGVIDRIGRTAGAGSASSSRRRNTATHRRTSCAGSCWATCARGPWRVSWPTGSRPPPVSRLGW